MNRRQRPELAVAKAELRQAARELGCKIDWGNWQIKAPPNKCFGVGGGPDNGLHELPFQPLSWQNYSWEVQYRDAVKRLECGLEDCHCGNCDPKPF